MVIIVYSLTIKDTYTNKVWKEYGFTHRTMSRLHKILNEYDSDRYEVIHLKKLILCMSTFKKCLTKKVEYINK